MKDLDKLKYILVGDYPGDTIFNKGGIRPYLGANWQIFKFIHKYAKENEILNFYKVPFFMMDSEKCARYHPLEFKMGQKMMAQQLIKFMLKSSADVWIINRDDFIGKEKLKWRGLFKQKIFVPFQKEFNKKLKEHPELKNRVYVFSHPVNNGFIADIFQIIIGGKGHFDFEKFRGLGKEKAYQYFDMGAKHAK